MIPESDIVKVSVNVSQAALTQNGFGLVAIFGTSAVLPSGQRFGIYTDINDVAAVFPTTSPEYIAASKALSQSPAPAQGVMIARMFPADAPAELLGGLNPDANIAHYTAINNGSLKLTIDGTVEQITGINLAAVATLPAVAAAVQAALQATVAGATVTYSQGQFIVRSGTSGAASSLSFAVAATAGTDLAPMLKLRQTDGATLTQGIVAETVTQSLTAVNALMPDWYSFGLAFAGITNQNIEDAAAYALSTGKVCGYTTSDPTVLNAASQADIASILLATENKRVIGIFDLTGLEPYAIFSVLAQAATVDFSGANTTETLMFKQLPGVTVSNITSTMKAVLDSKNINYYVSVGGNPMFMKGVMSDGSFFDQVQGLDWLSKSLGSAVFSGLYGNRKVPQTDKGMATVLHWLETVLAQGVRNGLLAPGVWNGTGIGQIKTGDYLAKGYYAFADSVDNQTQAQRNTRIGPNVSVIAKGAGALQGINIDLTFQQ